ncbi:hypothetical protein JZ751_011951 [Albula glossodonta]|uniref:Uncharacterized protein n=1 Tax=Albula glossodonta TaxID=121402 RepID=A0A8T2PR16_9TELE|nr:hypothetical protein JZ751_011951 [Albula glossodonta]
MEEWGPKDCAGCWADRGASDSGDCDESSKGHISYCRGCCCKPFLPACQAPFLGPEAFTESKAVLPLLVACSSLQLCSTEVQQRGLQGQAFLPGSSVWQQGPSHSLLNLLRLDAGACTSLLFLTGWAQEVTHVSACQLMPAPTPAHSLMS